MTLLRSALALAGAGARTPVLSTCSSSAAAAAAARRSAYGRVCVLQRGGPVQKQGMGMVQLQVQKRTFQASAVRAFNPEHDEETFDEFTARFEKEFEKVNDVFELQRNLNNCFAYDLVPSVAVIEAALRASRRVNDFPSAVRVFEGIKAKVENKYQYEQYIAELEGIREELGVPLKEVLYPEDILPEPRK